MKNIEAEDIENYENNNRKNSDCNIDNILREQGLYRLDTFKYNVGDYLFYLLQFLLNNTYTSIQLRKGIVTIS